MKKVNLAIPGQVIHYDSEGNLIQPPPAATHHCLGCEAAARERDDLRTRLAALAAEWERSGELTTEVATAARLRALLAETEAK